MSKTSPCIPLRATGQHSDTARRQAVPGEYKSGRLIKNIYLALGATALLTGLAATAQPYPSKPVRILTSAPGNSDDLAARLIAQGITGGLGQQAVVDNRGVVAVDIAAKSPPDGYTLLLYGSPMWLAPFMRDKLPYDPVKDFVAVTWATNSPNLLVVHPALPVKSVRELVTLAKERPNELNYGSGSAGSTPHLAAELLRAMTGVQIVRVAYKGSGPAFPDEIAGRVQLMIDPLFSALPYIKAGKLKAIAIASAKRAANTPDIPTVAETLPGFVVQSLNGIVVPAATPRPIVAKISSDLATALRHPDVRARMAEIGLEPAGSTPEEFDALIRSEIERWAKVVKFSGAKAE